MIFEPLQGEEKHLDNETRDLIPPGPGVVGLHNSTRYKSGGGSDTSGESVKIAQIKARRGWRDGGTWRGLEIWRGWEARNVKRMGCCEDGGERGVGLLKQALYKRSRRSLSFSGTHRHCPAVFSAELGLFSNRNAM